MLKINPTRPPAVCPPACFAAVEREPVGSLQASQGRRHTRLTQAGLVRLPLSPHRQHVRARCGSEPCLTPHGCVQKLWHIRAAKSTQKCTWIQANKHGTTRTHKSHMDTLARVHKDRCHEHTKTHGCFWTYRKTNIAGHINIAHVPFKTHAHGHIPTNS